MKNLKIDNPSPELEHLFSFREWRQRIHLFDEVYTPGTRCEYEWDLCFMPSSLQGKTFIDVGSNDGMFSFMAERRGAKVKAVDLYSQEDNTNWNMTQGWAINRILALKKILKSQVEVEARSIYDLKASGQTFDIVFCGNVIAWLQNPLDAINQLAGAANERLIIREDISKVKGKPLLEYVNKPDFSGCYFNGSEAFYRTYLSALGFKKISIQPVDEYHIMELRDRDFPKFDIPANTSVYKNPFTKESEYLTSIPMRQNGAALVNGRYFFNTVGWVKQTDASILQAKMIPTNPIKRALFEYRCRKNMLNNCMIIAER